MSEEIKETAGGELTQGEFKIKKAPKKLINKEPSVKIDLSKPKEVVEEAITKIDLSEEKVEKPTVEEEEIKLDDLDFEDIASEDQSDSATQHDDL